MTNVENLIRWHALYEFFEGLDEWKKASALVGLRGDISLEEYERLLMGTDADTYVPLWASACLSGEDILLNEITLEVIKYYKQFGYRPVRMDGNPPDYIGEQCRFMEYLYASSEDMESCENQEAEEFLDRFLMPCAYKLAECAKNYKFEDSIISVVDLLLDSTKGKDTAVFYDEINIEELKRRRGEAIPLDSLHTVSHVSFCDCGNKCKMLSQVQEGCVLSILPDKDFMGKSFAGCPRGLAYRSTFLSSHRLRYPMMRVGERGEGKFRRVSWSIAEDYVAREVKRTRESYGPESRFVLPAAGNCALIRGDRLIKHLLNIDGGSLDFYNFYSASCAEHILPYIYGTLFCGSAEEHLKESKLLILWGHNPVATHFGDQHAESIIAAKEKGAKVIVIDPRRTDTAELFADEWIPIRPATDGALSDAMAYEILSRGLEDRDFIDKFCIGFDEEHMPPGVPYGESYKSYLYGLKDGIVKNAKWAEPITGIPESKIISLAIEFATTKPACLLPGLGPQRTLSGEQATRSHAMLACLTGNVGKIGGGAGAINYIKDGYLPAFSFAWKEVADQASIPRFIWTRAIESPETITPKDGLLNAEKLSTGIKLIFSLASGILLNQHSNINETARVLKGPDLETLIVSDILMTPGSRFADLLLPGVSFFETENIMFSWSSADYMLYNRQAIEPLFGSLSEFYWIQEVARRLGLQDEFNDGRTDSHNTWIEKLYEDHRKANEGYFPDFHTVRENGGLVLPAVERDAAFAKNIKEGIPFDTPSGKIEIFSERLYKGDQLPGIPCYTPIEEGAEQAGSGPYPLQLIGYHSKRRCHSIGEGNSYLNKLEPPRVWINPMDASKRGIANGEMVEVYNARGTVKIEALVTENIVNGVVAMSEGAWYAPDEKGRDKGGCINVLTMTHKNTPFAHANPQHTNLVEVRKAEN